MAPQQMVPQQPVMASAPPPPTNPAYGANQVVMASIVPEQTSEIVTVACPAGAGPVPAHVDTPSCVLCKRTGARSRLLIAASCRLCLHRPGSTLQVQAPKSGKMMSVTVPAGVGPGMQFQVQL